MTITVKVIPHNAQRYDTVGDWFFNYENDTLFIFISKMKDWRYEFLVARHEMDEAMLCYKRGIKEEDVTDFDKLFERERAKLKHTEDAEPGDDPRAPYKAEHFFATTQERVMAAELGVDWAQYEAEIFNLDYDPNRKRGR